MRPSTITAHRLLFEGLDPDKLRGRTAASVLVLAMFDNALGSDFGAAIDHEAAATLHGIDSVDFDLGAGLLALDPGLTTRNAEGTLALTRGGHDVFALSLSTPTAKVLRAASLAVLDPAAQVDEDLRNLTDDDLDGGDA